jgi:hypothetical protein
VQVFIGQLDHTTRRREARIEDRLAVFEKRGLDTSERIGQVESGSHLTPFPAFQRYPCGQIRADNSAGAALSAVRELTGAQIGT